MKKFLSKVLPISLAAVLVLGLMPAIGVKAANVIPAGENTIGLYESGEFGEPNYQNDVLRLPGDASATAVSVDAANKTVTFTDLNAGRMDIDVDGWTFVFIGTNTIGTELVIEAGSATVSVQEGGNLTVGTKIGGVVALGTNTISSVAISTEPSTHQRPVYDYQNWSGEGEPDIIGYEDYEAVETDGPVVFTNSADAEEETPAEEEKKEETPAEEPAKEETKEETTTPVELKILDGANQEVDGTGDVTIRANGEFANFDKLLMDDKEVDPVNYDKKEGSTIVTLKAAYVASLGAGAHTVSFVYKDGSAVKTTLTLKAAGNSEAAPAAENTSTPAATPAPAAAATDSVAPKTGENIMWIYVILAMSALGMGVTAVSIKKNK